MLAYIPYMDPMGSGVWPNDKPPDLGHQKKQEIPPAKASGFFPGKAFQQTSLKTSNSPAIRKSFFWRIGSFARNSGCEDVWSPISWDLVCTLPLRHGEICQWYDMCFRFAQKKWWNGGVPTSSGWWCQTWMLFSMIYVIILPIDQYVSRLNQTLKMKHILVGGAITILKIISNNWLSVRPPDQRFPFCHGATPVIQGMVYEFRIETTVTWGSNSLKNSLEKISWKTMVIPKIMLI